jgi:hypothetical protein
MQSIIELRKLSFSLTIDHDDLVVKYTGAGQPDPATVKPLLAELRNRKQDALDYLRQRTEAPDQGQPPATSTKEAPATHYQATSDPSELARSTDKELLITGAPDEMDTLGTACREQIRMQGYCLVKSAVLGEIIAVVDSDHRRNLAPKGHATYTLRELELLAEGHRAGHIVTIGDLRMLHAAKKHLSGVIVK